MSTAAADTKANKSNLFDGITLPPDLAALLEKAPEVIYAESVEELVPLATGGSTEEEFEVAYDIPGKGSVVEAVVTPMRNGVVANYMEPYMRRRDPNCMLIADDLPTDKQRFKDRFGKPFDGIREETFEWLATQPLVVFVFQTGRKGVGKYVVSVSPKNAAFFAAGLALLQGIYSRKQLSADTEIAAVMYVAPPFRHTHFEEKQVVVHRRGTPYEMFAYNLYPGPSAKKGVYGMLLGQGEEEGWVTAHCSTVQVITPYDNIVTMMHEGASGGGKSELLQQPHRTSEGLLRLGKNIVTGEERFLELPRTCNLRPVVDDMAICHPSMQSADGRLGLTDAENAWFVRVDHIKEYGTDLDLEKMTAQPSAPLVFLNVNAVPKGHAMIWDHKEDEPGKPCPNPRVIVPRKIVPDIVDDTVRVDIRSLGVRCPPCTRENPNYGIIGLFHVLPPALAWLWRLVAPRGHANPSITDTAGMSSEGVGSYWPFATGKKVTQANLLLQQIEQTPRTQFVLMPNQHVGAWKTGFMPEWISRDYLARRGTARFKMGHIVPARCPLLGYAVYTMRVEGTTIPHWFLEVNTQPEVGNEGYDAGAKILQEFFTKNLEQFLTPDLSRLGRWIIEACLDGADVNEYQKLLPSVFHNSEEASAAKPAATTL